MENWDQVTSCVKLCFVERSILTQLSWSTVVLVPKGSGNYQGIGLLEIVWKTIESIINRQIAQKITFNDSLHGFVAEKGTGTAYVNNWRRWFRKPCILSFQIYTRPMILWIGSVCRKDQRDMKQVRISGGYSFHSKKFQVQLRNEKYLVNYL